MEEVGGVEAAVHALAVARDAALDLDALRRRPQHELLQVLLDVAQVGQAARLAAADAVPHYLLQTYPGNNPTWM